jgi:hypothetical protein
VAYGNLLQGMLATDGITVLRTDGAILAYNAFVRLQQDEAGPARAAVGGARKRAHFVLRRLVDEGSLVAAFFRSADGPSEFYGGKT